MNDLQNRLEALLTSVKAYNDKPNKSLSKRIRVALGSLKTDITDIRRTLVAADKDGYK